MKKTDLKCIGINKKKEMRMRNTDDQNGERKKNAWNRKEYIQENKWILLSLKERNVIPILKREY